MTDVPQLLGSRFEVGPLIGRGGMAEVHLGFDTRLGRQVAIKILRTDLARDPSFLSRFRREAQSAAGLNHAAIVGVYDSGEDHVVESGGAEVSVPYIVMEYVKGRTLREVLNERGPLSANEACRITEGVLDALSYSHRMGIVHRDIKPANVMIGDDGAVKVMDFGIARAIADANATMTQTQAVIGTAQYLSPEQAQGQTVDARSDIYSTGCMLYELLTGRPPFIGDSPVAIAYQHVGEPVVAPSTLVPDVPLDLDKVIAHALVKDRNARYQDAATFRTDLTHVRLGRAISAEALASAPTPLSRPGAAAPTEVYAAAPPPIVTEPTVAMPPVRAAVARRDTGGPHTAAIPAVPPPPEKRRGAGAYVLVALAVLLTLAALAFGAMKLLDGGSTTPRVTVPTVVDKPQATAEFELKTAGLVPKVEQAASDTVAKGTVISQDPQGGQQADKGAVVTITVSSGKDAVVVPDLVGKTEQEARQLLTDLELTLGTVTPEDNADQDKGKILKSTPGKDEEVAPGTVVNVVIASGKVAVPNVAGYLTADALTAIGKAKLVPKVTYQQVGADQVGKVISQNPNSGTLEVGGSVNLVVGVETPPTPTSTPTPDPSQTPTPDPSPSPSPTP